MTARFTVKETMPEKRDSSGEQTLTLDSDLEQLELLHAFIDNFCEREGLPDQTCYHLNVALEELVINAMKHGACEPSTGAIRLAMRMDGGEVRITMCDTGIAFNPLDVPPPDLNQNVLSRPVGGLGIHLVRCLIPGIRYERHDGRNYLYLTKPVERDCALVSEERDTDANGNGDHPA